MGEVAGEATVDGHALYAKISWRLIPYIFLLYIVAYLDRVNVGFAALDLQRDLHFSNTVYGTGAGIFFLGSMLFDLPSNLMLTRVGARLWIARIMISWGGDLDLHDVHALFDFVLCAAISAWGERGRIFPGDDYLSDVLVS